MMAIGDILAVAIRPDGWSADITIEGFSTGATYDFGLDANNVPSPAKILFSLSSSGFNDLGEGVAVPRTVYATKQVRKQHPDHAQTDETVAGGNMTVRVALSEFIYTSDASITVDILSGFCTSGGTPNNQSLNLAVTNNSSEGLQRVVGNWSYPGYSTVTGNFKVRCCAFHGSAKDGKPVKCVKFTATDENSNSYSTIVTAPTIDTTIGDALPVVEYVGEIDVSGFVVGNKITVNFIAYPHYGNMLNTGDGVNDNSVNPTPLYAPQYYKLVSDRKLAVVDSAAADDLSGVVINESAFDAGAPPAAFKNMFAAINAIRTAMGTADVSGGVVLLRTGNHVYNNGTITSGTTANYWLTIKNFPNETPVLPSKSGSASLPTRGLVKFEGIEFTPTTGNFIIEKSAWLHKCDINHSGGYVAIVDRVLYLTENIVRFRVESPFGTGTHACGVCRGNSFVAGVSKISPFMFIGNVCAGNDLLQLPRVGVNTPLIDNGVLAFNSLRNNTTELFMYFFTDVVNHGFAIVQNLMERQLSVSPLFRVSGDGSDSSPVRNILIWHNTTVGQRLNLAYNDYNLNGTFAIRSQWSIKNNVIDSYNVVTGKDAHGGTADTTRDLTGNGSVRYGVGMSGNAIWGTAGFYNEHWGAKGTFENVYFQNEAGGKNFFKFVNNASGSGSNTNGGDYHLAEDSIAVDSSNDLVIPYDLDGEVRFLGGSAGVYEELSDPITPLPLSGTFDIGPEMSAILSLKTILPLSASFDIGPEFSAVLTDGAATPVPLSASFDIGPHLSCVLTDGATTPVPLSAVFAIGPTFAATLIDGGLKIVPPRTRTRRARPSDSAPFEFYIDPDAVLDYAIDWSIIIPADDPIVNLQIVTTDSTKVFRSYITGSLSVVWPQSITVNTTVSMTARITSQSGRKDDRTFTFIGKHF
jgi:hypothetical protein